jgi:hypothetical protein
MNWKGPLIHLPLRGKNDISSCSSRYSKSPLKLRQPDRDEGILRECGWGGGIISGDFFIEFW